jgi:hypothetical protein
MRHCNWYLERYFSFKSLFSYPNGREFSVHDLYKNGLFGAISPVPYLAGQAQQSSQASN